MKTRITILLAVLFVGANLSFAQQNEECMTKLSLFHTDVKAKNYDNAYDNWMFVRTTCPKFSRAIIQDGEKILEHKIENSSGTDKVAYINDLLKLYDEALANFSSKYKTGKVLADKAQLMYDNKAELNKTDADVYAAFDEAFTKDQASFTSPKGLYAYFSLMVDLYDAGKQPAQALFKKYDEIVAKVESEVKNYSERLNKLIEKEEAGTKLGSKEKRYKEYYGQMLTAYDQISGSINSKLGSRADCENLVPLFNKEFEENKTNKDWLNRAAGLMSQKGCAEDPLFFKLVNALHEVKPSANSAYYLGLLKEKEGDMEAAFKYFDQAITLETDTYKKAGRYETVAGKLKKVGRYSKARNYYNKSLSLNPSNGRPHLAIAGMYAKSAKNCGDNSFNKQAVYWLAASEARKASKADPTLSKAANQAVKSYSAIAPSKDQIFSKGNAGQTIKIGCWIQRSITVPSL